MEGTMLDLSLKKPQLPPGLRQVSRSMTLLYLAYGLLLFIVPAGAAGFAVTQPLPGFVRAAAVLILALIAGLGLHVMGFAGHDGIHFNLHRNKYMSVALAIFFTAPVGMYLVMGFALTHWNHHRFTNQASDPDAEIYSRYNSFWKRMLLSRMRGTRAYSKNTWRIALRRPVPYSYKIPLSAEALVWFARLNILLSYTWLAVYAAIIVRAPLVGLASIVLPHVSAYFIAGLRAYIEHAGTGIGPFRDTRSYTAPFFTILCFGNNYHLEHHLYPSVPCYRLPDVHRHLKTLDTYARAGASFETTVLGVTRYMTSAFAYPGTEACDNGDDPFLTEPIQRDAPEPRGKCEGRRGAFPQYQQASR